MPLMQIATEKNLWFYTERQENSLQGRSTGTNTRTPTLPAIDH